MREIKLNIINKEHLVFIFSITLFALLFVTVFLPIETNYLPNYFTNSFFLFTSTLILGSFVIALINLWKNEAIKITSIDIVFFFFAGYTIIRFAIHPLSHWTQGSFFYWVVLFTFYFFFRVLVTHLTFRVLLTTLTIITLILFIIGQLQLFNFLPTKFSLFNPSKPIFKSESFIVFLSMVFPLALFEVLREESDRSKWIYYLSWVAMAAILLMVVPFNSKLAWIAVISGSVLVVVLRFDLITRIQKRSKIWLRTSIVGIAVLVVSGGYYLLSEAFNNGSILIWKISSQMWQKQSIFGIGLTRFASEYNLAQANYFENGGTDIEALLADNVKYAFNDFLQIGVELGIVGLFFFVAIPVIALFSKTKDNSVIPIKGGILVWGVFAVFSHPSFVLVTAVLFLVFLAFLSHQQKRDKSFIKNRLYRKIGFSLILFLASFFMGVWVAKTYPAVQNWKKGNQYYSVNQYKRTEQYYTKAFKALSYNGQFLQHFGQCLWKLGKNEASLKFLTFAKDYQNDPPLYCNIGLNYYGLGQYQEAEQSFLKAHHMIPNRWYPEYLLAKNYFSIGKRKEAAILAKNLLEKELKKESTVAHEILQELKALSAISY